MQNYPKFLLMENKGEHILKASYTTIKYNQFNTRKGQQELANNNNNNHDFITSRKIV